MESEESMPHRPRVLGFIGLGQMGAPMAANIAKSGATLICFDKAGTTERLPDGASAGGCLSDIVQSCDTIFLSLPDGAAVNAVANEIASTRSPRSSVVIDLSTIGIEAAKSAAALLDQAEVTYVDAPVSGGRAGAVAGTITLMWGGPKAELERHRDVINMFCGNPFHVGDRPGQGQAVKLLNNFLSATALVATSEAVLYGLSHGLDMKTILDVVNVSTGMNTATRDKFPQQVLTAQFNAGFFARLLNKDVQLYFESVDQSGTPKKIANVVANIWSEAAQSLPPDSDFTLIYEAIKQGADQ
ncbi:MAG: NAD(P)-dependent oxidoreductase [Hyphomicrobiaceae bacterium]